MNRSELEKLSLYRLAGLRGDSSVDQGVLDSVISGKLADRNMDDLARGIRRAGDAERPALASELRSELRRRMESLEPVDSEASVRQNDAPAATNVPVSSEPRRAGRGETAIRGVAGGTMAGLDDNVLPYVANIPALSRFFPGLSALYPNKNFARARWDQGSSDYPVTAGVSYGAGALAGSAAVPAVGGKVAAVRSARFVPKAARAVQGAFRTRPGATVVAGGGVEGAIHGAGNADGKINPFVNAIIGGLAGAAGAGVAQVAGNAIVPFARWVRRKWPGTDAGRRNVRQRFADAITGREPASGVPIGAATEEAADIVNTLPPHRRSHRGSSRHREHSAASSGGSRGSEALRRSG